VSPWAAIALSLVVTSAGAQEPGDAPAPAPADRRGEEAQDETQKDPERSPSLDFDDLLPAPPEAAAPDPRLTRKVERRRTMLTLHQGLGFATWGTLAATTLVGQLDFNDRFRGGGDTGRYHGWHRGLAYGTSALFVSAGLLALLAPEPYAKRTRLDTATLHKVAMAVATTGMVAQVALGVAARGRAGTVRERDLANAHQVTGYATLGAMTVGVVVLFF
jgi:hypothetical protein